MFIIGVVVFALLFDSTFGCKCGAVSHRDAFCQAKWVSHIKVESAETLESTILYTVKHLNVFKKPNATLGNTIDTPASSATCGVEGLDMGSEYLVAGNLAKEQPRIVSCLRFDGPDGIPGALPWNSVSDKLKAKLQKGDFGKCP